MSFYSRHNARLIASASSFFKYNGSKVLFQSRSFSAISLTHSSYLSQLFLTDGRDSYLSLPRFLLPEWSSPSIWCQKALSFFAEEKKSLEVTDAILMISTMRRRTSKMNKHKRKKRAKALRMTTKSSRS